MVAEILFCAHLGQVDKPIYDETYYVPAAKAILQAGQDPNPQHPPLGKELIAAGIRLAGDRPGGWGGLRTVFGSLTLVAFYFLALAVLQDSSAALFAALLALFNNLLFVLARIAMLEVFMTAFLFAGLALFWRQKILCARRVKSTQTNARIQLWLAGASLGLAAAC